MNDALGAWPNAPLAYVLAEVRTEHLADLKDYQPKLAGRFREEYPLQRVKHATRLMAAGTQLLVEAEPDAMWEFATPDNRIAILLRTNGLVLHATRYHDSRDFLARLDRAVRLFADEVPAVYVNRLGLRYLDFIIPGTGETPEAYVDTRLNPDLGLSRSVEGPLASSIAVYKMGAGQLTLRYFRGPGDPELPPDLGKPSLDSSPLMQPGKVPSGQASAIMDTDCIHNFVPVELLDPVRMLAHFTAMRQNIKEAFETAITEHARRVWEGQ